jgi:cyclophilin family peptidyl-prolyl cis-trans isomerase/HEAT repeat protein
VRGAFPSLALAEDLREREGVLPFASSDEPAVRARAALALGRIVGAPSVAPLARLAQDPDPEVAAVALFALGLVGVGEGSGPIEARLSDPDARLRAAALEALGRGREDRLAPACAERLEDPDPSVRGEAALALFRLVGERFAGPRTLDAASLGGLIKRLGRAAGNEPDAEARWREAYALAAIRDGRTREALLRAREDSSPLVRLFAIRGLGKLDPDPDVDPALARAAADPDDAVATEAAAAIARHPSREAAAALLALLDREAVAVRRVAVRSLGAMGAFGEEAAFERAGDDPSPSVRGEVVPARARLGGEEVLSAVEEALADLHPLVREKACEAAARLPETDALLLLERALRDPAPSVAAAAATAVGKFRGGKARDLACAALRHASGLVRENAAGVLAAWAKEGDPPPRSDVAALLDAIEASPAEDFSEVRASLLEALEAVESARRAGADPPDRRGAGSERGARARLRGVLERALPDPDPTVRAKAASAWERLVGEPLPPAAPLRRRPSPIPGATAPPFLRDPRVRFFTARGEFEATLFAEDAPVHVENFLRIARAGRYAGTPFHRVEPNFVVQGGDHLGDGTGVRAAEGGTIRDEINRRRFLRGTIGMPKTDVPDSGGSQIFIALVPTPHLDGRYTAFGQVDAGMEVVDAIEVGDRIEAVEILDPGR